MSPKSGQCSIRFQKQQQHSTGRLCFTFWPTIPINVYLKYMPLNLWIYVHPYKMCTYIWVFWRLVRLSITIRETSSLKISTIATVQISYFLSKKSACHIIFSKRGNDKWLLFSLVTARLAVMVLCVDICAQVWVKYDFRLSSSSV